ncbi:hypothetical protein POM88_021294 [Heracleum sosnowskyi]|uniref:Endonuclease/exonuclease/phosphatase domain-containing protein n=1 Tax=Heracleum sosnowskyi TaxID=360622 RepID=A0AAD8ID35_9APIA|nr:hypothetical protein POM88_021294 [Heracleum sosnowskyi]
MKTYGDWMRAPIKRQIKPIGAKWLRNGSEGGSRSSGEGRVDVRLDRALVTPAFFTLFKDAKLTNLEVSTSDHSPLWLEPHIAIQDRSFYDKLNQCLEVLSAWGQEVTGSFKKRINHSKKVLKTLKGRRDEEAIIAVREEKKKLSETYAQQEVFLEAAVKTTLVK